jgi:3-phenylpropionate/trans-cinnamate dioxygenase ferredoxin reductase subunit
VESVLPETHNTYNITLKPDAKSVKHHKPGQFAFLELKRPGRKSEIHPFTIASSPTFDTGLRFTIKQSGNFTNTIDQTRTSDKAYVEAPYGQFSFLNYARKPILFIAGGVGITPIMSMMRYLRDTGDFRRALLLYGSCTRKDIIFEDELKALPENFEVIHILSDPDDDWDGLKGFVTEEVIADRAGSVLDEAEVFVCGPPQMMDKVIASLKHLDVNPAHIHYERFTI